VAPVVSVVSDSKTVFAFSDIAALFFCCCFSLLICVLIKGKHLLFTFCLCVKHLVSGVNRHFQMVFLHDKFNGALDRKISSKEIWNHLMEMYDLNSLVCFLEVFVVILNSRNTLCDL